MPEEWAHEGKEMNNRWCDDLCEYYDVDEEVALKLGTRASGRKPSLPGSKTCDPVSEMTFEDIWSLKDRSDIESVFQFYIDQGSWSTFRQCVRHKDLSSFHLSQIVPSINSSTLRHGFHICEYGCGVAPFLNTFLTFLDPSSVQFRLSITDVDGCEHFNFAEWRLKKKVLERSLDIELEVKPVTSNTLPTYSDKLDLVLIFEVLEHVPSPLETIKNIYNQLNDGACVIENFIKHPDEEIDNDGPDLASAASERSAYYSFLIEKFNLIGGETLEQNQDGTRIWRKK